VKQVEESRTKNKMQGVGFGNREKPIFFLAAKYFSNTFAPEEPQALTSKSTNF